MGIQRPPRNCIAKPSASRESRKPSCGNCTPPRTLLDCGAIRVCACGAIRVCAAARDLLAPVYSWFTEGFATRDLKEAKMLLDELNA
jgi:hypothetical protein